MERQDLLEHLNEQVYFIEKSIDDFEKNEIEAKRVATNIRTLVHDTSNSISLLKKLDAKDILFVDTNGPKNGFSNWKITNVVMSGMEVVFGQNSPYVGIVGKEIIGQTDGKVTIKYFPIYKEWKEYKSRISFDEWWNAEIFDNKLGDVLTRKDLILNVANKDGGAHVDNLKREYSSFKKNDIISFVVEDKLQGFDNIPAFPAVMQIAWELVESIKTEIL